MVDFEQLIEKLPRVGPRNASRLQRLGIQTVGDLLRHFPARYQDFSLVVPISEIRRVGEVVSVHGVIQEIQTRMSWKRRRLAITTARVQDPPNGGPDGGEIRGGGFGQPFVRD